MKKIALTLITAAFALTAQSGFAAGCADKAVGKNGKPLAGAAKNAFMKKCEADAKGDGTAAPAPNAQCAEKAVGKNGKPLAGAAKATFMKKCEADANAAK